VVACIEQYRYNNLHIYANGGTLCDNDDVDNNGKSEHHADVYGSKSHLFGRNIECFANDVNEWYNGYMVACIEQYRNDDLYIYANGGTVCNNDDNVDNNGQSDPLSNVRQNGRDTL
jgi:hypothetical protein